MESSPNTHARLHSLCILMAPIRAMGMKPLAQMAEKMSCFSDVRGGPIIPDGQRSQRQQHNHERDFKQADSGKSGGDKQYIDQPGELAMAELESHSGKQAHRGSGHPD